MQLAACIEKEALPLSDVKKPSLGSRLFIKTGAVINKQDRRKTLLGGSRLMVFEDSCGLFHIVDLRKPVITIIARTCSFTVALAIGRNLLMRETGVPINNVVSIR